MLSSEDFKSLVFNMLIEGTLDYAIFMLDKEGNVISWNSGAEKIFGYQVIKKFDLVNRNECLRSKC